MFAQACRASRVALLLGIISTQVQAGPIIHFTDNLTDATYNTAVGVVDGVVTAAVNFWTDNIPLHPGFVKTLDDNATFNVIFNEGNADPASTTAAPAGTKNPAALPAGFSFVITVDNARDDIADMFWDPTPATTLDEFTATSTSGRYIAKAGGPADGKFDMFTVLEHELGHVVAYNTYTDFQTFVTNDWNKRVGVTKIDLATAHFIGGSNLMSSGAALPDGKNGRVFAQPEDYLVPEPGSSWMVWAASTVIVVGLRRKRRQPRPV